jgi:4-oxalmesaconate hydratase
MNLMFEVIGVDHLLFASEVIGAVRGIDPLTGHYFDDTKRYIDAIDLSETQRQQVFEGNALRVFPRLRATIERRGG